MLPVQGPVNAPVQAQPTVEELLKQLTNKKVDTLWKEKVSDQNFAARPFLKIFHYVCLLLGVGKMGEAQAEDSNVEALEKAADELVRATAGRLLKGEERKTEIHVTGSKDEVYRAEYMERNCEEKLQKFYEAFATRVKDLTSLDSNFIGYAKAARKLLNAQMDWVNANGRPIKIGGNIFSSEKVSFSSLNKDKLKTTKKLFNQKIFDGLVNSFAKQEIQNITVEGYKAKRNQICDMFKAPIKDVEVLLRNAIRENHPNLADLSTEFGNTAADAPRFVARKEALKTSLDADLLTVNNRLRELCGLQGNDGLVNIAWTELDAANRTFNEKRDAFRSLITAQGQDLNDIAVLLAIDPANPATVEAKAAFVAANTAKIAKQAAFDALKAEMDQLAIWNQHGQIVGGKQADISAKLNNIDATVTAECAQLSKFYAELAKEFNTGTNSLAINHNNTLHASMQTVIGN